MTTERPFDPLDSSGVIFPDLGPYARGNTDISHLHRLESGVAGPHVMISALVHGNEVCGAHGLIWLLQSGWKPARGMVSLAFVNIAAYERFDAGQPMANRFVDEDFNRLWDPRTLDGDRDSTELRRARELRPHLDTVDLLLDLHSMYVSPDPLMMAGPLDKGRRLAETIGIPEHIIMDEGHAAGRRMRDYAGFGDPNSPRNALLIECGSHFWAEAGALAQHCMARFLEASGVADQPPQPAAPLPVGEAGQKVVRVEGPHTIEHDDFAFTRPLDGMEVIAKAGTVFARDGGQPVVTPFDDCVMVMPNPFTRQPGDTAVRFGRLLNGG